MIVSQSLNRDSTKGKTFKNAAIETNSQRVTGMIFRIFLL